MQGMDKTFVEKFSGSIYPIVSLRCAVRNHGPGWLPFIRRYARRYILLLHCPAAPPAGLGRRHRIIYIHLLLYDHPPRSSVPIGSLWFKKNLRSKTNVKPLFLFGLSSCYFAVFAAQISCPKFENAWNIRKPCH